MSRRYSGDRVRHHGAHYTVDGIRFLPRPIQRPRVPVCAAEAGATWWLTEFAPEGLALDRVLGVVHDGPAIPSAQ